MDMARLSLTATFGAVFLIGLSTQAFAAAEGYCDAYARDAANRKARNSAGNVMAGSALNPVISGASISTAGGSAALSADAANNKWRRAYIAAYDDCMFQYETEKVTIETAAAAPAPAPSEEVIVEEVDGQGDIPPDEAAPEKPVKKAKAKGKAKPEPGTQAWNNVCDRRYRSFNPKTGLYKSLLRQMAEVSGLGLYSPPPKFACIDNVYTTVHSSVMRKSDTYSPKGFEESAVAVRERSSSGDTKGSINLRIEAGTRQLIDSAAAILGKTRTEFMVESARREAIDVLLDQRLFALDSKRFDAFMDALDNPPAPGPKLRSLLRRVPAWQR